MGAEPALDEITGTLRVYQGRFKPFPVQPDKLTHRLELDEYVQSLPIE